MTGSQQIAAIPVGFTIVLDRETRYDDGGAVVWGGAPRRLLRLTAAGASTFHRLAAGEPVGDHRAGLLARRLVESGLAHPRPPGSHRDESASSIDVVIAARDRPGDLDACLHALAGRLPVTVVDDASVDRAAIASVAARHGAAVVRLSRNLGPAGARNAGVAATLAPVVAFVDSDCRVSASALRALTDHLADPCVGAAAPQVRPATESGSALDRYATARSPLDLGPRPATVRPDGRVTYVPTTALVVRRQAWQEVGGFDETLRYGEDVDLVWRLADAGWSVRYDPRVTARHREPSSWPAWLRRRFDYGTSAGPLATRHGARLAGPPLSGLVAPATLARRTRGRSLPAGARHLAAAAPAATALGLLRWGLPLWWPALLGVRRPALRRALTAAAGVAPVLEWWQHQPDLDPLRWVLLAVSDDVAYGAGVWTGCVRNRTIRPLLPRVRGARALTGSRPPSSP